MFSKENVFRFDSEQAVDKRIVDQLIQEAREREPDKTPKPEDEKEFNRMPGVMTPKVQKLLKTPSTDLANIDEAKYIALETKVMVPVIPSDATYRPKTEMYPPKSALLEPGYVVHGRLYFEEKNSERYGWKLGIMQPAVSLLYFYKDVALLPSHVASHLCERYDSNAGKCLPGSPIPYYLYPEGIDLFGYAAGAGAWVGISAVFIP